MKVYQVVEIKHIMREVPNYGVQIPVDYFKPTSKHHKLYKVPAVNFRLTTNFTADYNNKECTTTEMFIEVPVATYTTKEAALKHAAYLYYQNTKNSSTPFRLDYQNIVEDGYAEVEMGKTHNISVKEIEISEEEGPKVTKDNKCIYCIADMWIRRSDSTLESPIIHVWYGKFRKDNNRRTTLGKLKSHKENEVFKDTISVDYDSISIYSVIHEKDIHEMNTKEITRIIENIFVSMIDKFKDYINNHDDIIVSHKIKDGELKLGYGFNDFYSVVSPSDFGKEVDEIDMKVLEKNFAYKSYRKDMKDYLFII